MLFIYIYVNNIIAHTYYSIFVNFNFSMSEILTPRVYFVAFSKDLFI